MGTLARPPARSLSTILAGCRLAVAVAGTFSSRQRRGVHGVAGRSAARRRMAGKNCYKINPDIGLFAGGGEILR